MSRNKTSMPGPTVSKRAESKTKVSASNIANDDPGSIFHFFADRGARETFESIIIAVLLAILFRTFQVENYIIPTGSMAPGLMGHHNDIVCEQCQYQYQSNAGCEAPTSGSNDKVVSTYCPICHFQTNLLPQRNADHGSNQGDRIAVNKYIYDFTEPRRFDVIVFKNPTNAKQNYIKRLVGLPGESITIECGDLYRLTKAADGNYQRQIIYKPSDKLQAMLQLVDDTDHIAEALHEVQWPLRWQHWDRQTNPTWSTVLSNRKPVYQLAAKDSGEHQWLAYRHLEPEASDWDLRMEKLEVPLAIKEFNGKLITDYYAYNSFKIRPPNSAVDYNPQGSSPEENGLHWVGDLALEAWFNVTSNTGELILELIEAGTRFHCVIDVAAGTAKWQCADPAIQFLDESGNPAVPSAFKLPQSGAGDWHLQFAHCDNRLYLWVNGKSIDTEISSYQRSGPLYPSWTADDWGDLQPAAIGGKQIDMAVRRLKLHRDVYYTSIRGGSSNVSTYNEYGYPVGRIREVLRNPKSWSTSRGQNLFDARLRPGPPMFEVAEDGYMPCGDNSPSSLDSRVWDNPPFVRREMLIGRAMFVYWPHSLNRPVKYFPNFTKMRSIR